MSNPMSTPPPTVPREIDPDNDEQVLVYLRELEAEVERLRAVVAILLGLQRPEPPNPMPDFVDRFRALIHRADYEPQPDVPGYIYVPEAMTDDELREAGVPLERVVRIKPLRREDVPEYPGD